ncbi:MAG: glucose sorbosone dehydrogenase [Actinotalea sp.]|nr:glucose sorbosone dehydrogenase [Actinotalea sp.]
MGDSGSMDVRNLAELQGEVVRHAHLAARRGAVAVAVAAVLLAAGCSPDAPESEPTLATPTADEVVPSPSGDAEPVEPTPVAPVAGMPAGPVVPPATAAPQDVLTGLVSPWSLAFLPGGAVLVTLRDPGQVLLVTADGVAPLIGPGADALATTTRHDGEGGLLGIAVEPAADGRVFLYRTTDSGNEVVRARLDAGAGTLGDLEPVLTGIPAAGNHDGGRIAFGPDGFLYVTTGDAGATDRSQDPGSLGGKILRITVDGDPAPGNPEAGSPVWTLGHRNVQGIGWDADGRMFASEFGQNTFDELNLIEPGNNYGWPQVEGIAGAPGMTDPLVTWSTDVASPSGLAVSDGGVHLASLRGQRLWTVGFDGEGFAEPAAALVEELGRLRDVVVGPDGALWVLTQNTDGRGAPRDGDDRLVRLLPP